MHATTTYREVEVQVHSLLTSAVDVGSGKFHAPVAFPPGWRTPASTEQEAG